MANDAITWRRKEGNVEEPVAAVMSPGDKVKPLTPTPALLPLRGRE